MKVLPNAPPLLFHKLGVSHWAPIHAGQVQTAPRRLDSRKGKDPQLATSILSTQSKIIIKQ